jgi:hypothetical protein
MLEALGASTRDTSGSRSAVRGSAPGAGSPQPVRGSTGALTHRTLAVAVRAGAAAASVGGMRAPAPLLTAGLSAALLLTGCGGSDEGSSAASSSGSSSSSAAPTSSGSPAAGSSAPPSATSAEAAAFCQEAVSLEQSVNATVGTASNDPTQLAPALQRLADQYADVQAPAEIAGDWTALVDGVQQLATAAQGIDFTDPTAAQQLQAAAGGLQEQLTTATTNVSTYAAANCSETTPAPAPSS